MNQQNVNISLDNIIACNRLYNILEVCYNNKTRVIIPFVYDNYIKIQKHRLNNIITNKVLSVMVELDDEEDIINE